MMVMPFHSLPVGKRVVTLVCIVSLVVIGLVRAEDLTSTPGAAAAGQANTLEQDTFGPENENQNHRELRQSFFCRCVADYEDFYDNDDRRSLSAYYHPWNEGNEKDTTAVVSPRTSKYYKAEYRQYSSTATEDVTVGPDGWVIVDGITVLPLSNEACIVSQTNAALRAFLQIFYGPNASRSASDYWALFQGGRRKNRNLLKGTRETRTNQAVDGGENLPTMLRSGVRQLQFEGWEAKRRERLKKSRDRQPSIWEQDLSEGTDYEKREIPRVFPCPPDAPPPTSAPSSEGGPTAEPAPTGSPKPPAGGGSIAPSSVVPSVSAPPSLVLTTSPSPIVTISPVPVQVPSPGGPPVRPSPTIQTSEPTGITEPPAEADSIVPSSIIPSIVPSSIVPSSIVPSSMQPSIISAPSLVSTMPVQVPNSGGSSVQPSPNIEPPTGGNATAPTVRPPMGGNATAPTVRPPMGGNATAPTVRPPTGGNATAPTAPGGNGTAPTQPGGNATAPTAPGGNGTAPTQPGGNATAPTAPGGNATAPTVQPPTSGNTAAPTNSPLTTTDVPVLQIVGTSPQPVAAMPTAPKAPAATTFGQGGGFVLGTLPTSMPQSNIIESSSPLNDVCGKANDIVVGNAVLRFGSTVDAAQGRNFNCNQAGGLENNSPGVWYTTIGNGNEYTITTCFAETNFDTSIQVFVGSCDGLQCLAGGGSSSDPGCLSPKASAVTFFTEIGTRYYFLVFGRNAVDVGKFVLTLYENERAVIEPPV